MIEGLFNEEGDEDYSVLSVEQSKSNTLAGDLDHPPEFRSASATCYLNSLFQAIFMTPELRSAVFSFPLYNSSLNEPSNWLPQGQKFEILSALQELFVKLAYLDEKAVSTQNLTKSFGWTGAEVVVQHDVQELCRVFYDCLERALEGTNFSSLISDYCKGKFVNIVICSECGNESHREEEFADIGLQIKGCLDVYDSLSALVKETVLEGSEQYFCENCAKKVNAVRLTRITKIPKLLSFALNRFEYDTTTWERSKITQNFEYDLEIDLEMYCEGSGVYELFAVIIHQGSAHSGHYHAYIRDLLEEGNWVPLAQPVSIPSTVQNEELDTAFIEPEPTNNKFNKKSKKKGGKNKRKGKNKSAKNKEIKKNTEEVNPFEYQDFPRPCSDPKLLRNWFDFNDSIVTAIKSGKLKKQFGGSNETAYILIYRQKSATQLPKPQIPEYWKSAINSLNDSYKRHREEFQELKLWIEVQLQHIDLFDINEGVLVYKDKETKIINQGISLKLRLEDTVEDLKNLITINYIELIPDFFESHQIVISQALSNKCPHLLKHLDSLENHLTIQDAKIGHKSCLLVLPKNDPEIDEILNFTGEACEPILINLSYNGDKYVLYVNKAWGFMQLKEKISKKLKIPAEKINVIMRKFEGADKKIRDREEDLTLNELKFYHSIHLTVQTIEEEIPMKELAKNDQGEGLTSILLSDELNLEKTVQHLVNSEWKVKDLVEECRKLFEIPPEVPIRLRKLVDHKIICKEDQDSWLRNIPEFLEGGFRFQVERGEPPAYGLIVLKVALDTVSQPKEIFVKETERISEVKLKASEVLNFVPDQYKLYRTDWLKEPISVLKQENHTLFKAAVKDGDLLLAQTCDTVLDTEMKKLNIFVSSSGLPMDFKFVLEVSVPEESTLKQLKDILSQNPEINPQKFQYFRVREMTKTMWPGKVYREENKSMKKLSITFGSNLTVEFLNEPEVITFSGIYIYVGVRNLREKSVENIVPCIFDAGVSPNIDNLYEFVIKVLRKDWKVNEITIAKFKSQNFEWEIIKDQRPVQERGRLANAKPSTTAQGIYNLKKQPYLIKDGDLISVRYDKEEGASEDNFVCKNDAIAREEFLKRKINSKKTAKPARPEKAIKIGDF